MSSSTSSGLKSLLPYVRNVYGNGLVTALNPDTHKEYFTLTGTTEHPVLPFSRSKKDTPRNRRYLRHDSFIVYKP